MFSLNYKNYMISGALLILEFQIRDAGYEVLSFAIGDLPESKRRFYLCKSVQSVKNKKSAR